MNIKVTLNPEGLSKLKELEQTLVKNLGESIVNEAKRLAPVKTGKLRDSIEIKENTDMTVSVGSNLDYILFQEFGTRFQSGTPFLRPALDSTINNIKDQEEKL